MQRRHDRLVVAPGGLHDDAGIFPQRDDGVGHLLQTELGGERRDSVLSELPLVGESDGYEACPDEVALPEQIECCERERRLTDSKTGMLAHGNCCQAITLPF